MRRNDQKARCLGDFAGLWRLDRWIDDDNGPPGRLTGWSRWAPCDGGMWQVESGALEIGGQSFRAERRYLWRDDLSVCFEDGRFFHKVPPLGGQTDHWCAPDRYEVRYDFLGWPDFQTTWSVRGPRKAYRMVSHYTRSKDGVSAGAK